MGIKYELVITKKWLTLYWATLYVSIQYFYDVLIRHLKKKEYELTKAFFRTTHRLCTCFSTLQHLKCWGHAHMWRKNT